jgi:type I restriction enzyme R subunit
MTPPPVGFTETSAVEEPVVRLFESLGWNYRNLMDETFGQTGDLKREDGGQVVIRSKLLLALESINPGAEKQDIDDAVAELVRDRSILGRVQANREIYSLLKEGYRPAKGESEETPDRIMYIDWNHSKNNDFFLASQMWITGELHRKRPDLIGFVNGIPLILVELKNPGINIKDAFTDNIRDYKDTIPQLFWYNAFLICSNGIDTKIGSMSAPWEHFFTWKKINDEKEEGRVSIETAVKGICEPNKLLDYVENFTLFLDEKGGTHKVIAKNHQFLGVNQAIKGVDHAKENQGKLGVFWHTQGSGKSYSMIFFTEKILRKKSGKYTFVVVTDRSDLDEQIYKNFAACGAAKGDEQRADSADDLQKMLAADHRHIFTLIQKFRVPRGQTYPMVSERSDIIVIADEAHRTQYDTFALNMRNALPNSSFIGFTGTPLVAGEEATKKVFGDYVSVYNFKQSIVDEATVPLYYENRIPELQLVNENFNDDILKVIEEAELDEAAEKAIEQKFKTQYHLITRSERLDKIAEDVVQHFLGRGYQGKAMYVAIDRFTAISMCEKVKAAWSNETKKFENQLKTSSGAKKEAIAKKLTFMKSFDMAAIVSSSQNEIDDFRKKGIDIKPHRERMVKEDLETVFKDPKSNLKLVFVCAMWITGFDCPTCSTVYLDKPMKNHTLMQTIARANRVSEGKDAGLIVDYIGVLKYLEDALAIYGPGKGRDEKPINDKKELRTDLELYMGELNSFLENRAIIPQDIIKQSDELQKLAMVASAVEKLLETEQTRKTYLTFSYKVIRIFKAILPDPEANLYARHIGVFQVLRDRILNEREKPDLSAVENKIEEILDESIATEGYIIRAGLQGAENKLFDLSNVDFEALAKKLKATKKRTTAKILAGQIEQELERMIRLNRTRMDFYEEFRKLIDEYNSGSRNVEDHINSLLGMLHTMSEEVKRGAREGLTEEQLVLFDLLTKPDMKLSEAHRKKVLVVAKDLAAKIKQKLVIEWKKKQEAKAAVKTCIKDVLDEGLPEVYDRKVYNEKCELIYQHVFDTYGPEGQSPYEVA